MELARKVALNRGFQTMSTRPGNNAIILKRLTNPQDVASASGRAGDASSTVTYESRGSLLVIGDGSRVTAALDLLKGRLPVVALITGSVGKGAATKNVTFIKGRLFELSGYLGRFTAKIQGKQGPLDLGLLSPNGKGYFDLVLDLSELPCLGVEVPPLGYYAPGDDRKTLEHALADLTDLVGTYEKPKFFNYEPTICAHGRSGITGCTRCITACPTQAIASVGDRIQVDPHLCQGCAHCTTVCPSGALTYAYPSPAGTQENLRAMIHAFLEGGSDGPCLVFFDAQRGQALMSDVEAELPARVLPLPLQELTMVGLETWLAALAWGAAEVVLVASARTPRTTLAELNSQLAYAHAILAGMGYEPTRLRLLVNPKRNQLQAALASSSLYPALKPATFAPLNEKRTTLFLAIDHLVSQAPRPQANTELSRGAPLGEVRVDKEACTLCMGCVTVCPSKALRRGGNVTPRLRFVEGLCLQCGLCAEACPEDAIQLAPRLLYDREARSEARVLNEAAPFHCVSCGRPYTTQAIVERMMERLKDHPMFQGEGLKRLQLCEECRAQSVVIDQLQSLYLNTKDKRKE